MKSTCISGVTFNRLDIDTELLAGPGYGHAVLADLDGDGRPEFIVGTMGTQQYPCRLYWYDYQGPGKWARYPLGHDSLSDVGACAIDVDGDGRLDLVCGATWFHNPGNPQEREFTRHVMDEDGGGAHDVLAVVIAPCGAGPMI